MVVTTEVVYHDDQRDPRATIVRMDRRDVERERRTQILRISEERRLRERRESYTK